jgi:glycosyltransferase involved in cell wall biosynthesis
MKPVVSVLILTYNHFNYIEQAIKSVLDQKTNFDFEILIGDDCSTDGTCELVDSFISKYPNFIKAIRSEHNVGALRNEKRLMEASSGKYIAFLEGDDYWTDSLKLKKQVEFLEANPDYGLVHGDVNHYYQETNKTIGSYNKTINIKIPNGYIFDELIKPGAHLIKTMTTLFRKELIVMYFNYDIAISRNWKLTDMGIWLDIAMNSKVYYFNEVFATYRLIKESATRSKNPKIKNDFHVSIYELKKYYLNKYKKESHLVDLIEVEHYRIMIRDAFNLNNLILMNSAINFLKKSKYRITIKELVFFYILKFRITLGI